MTASKSQQRFKTFAACLGLALLLFLFQHGYSASAAQQPPAVANNTITIYDDQFGTNWSTSLWGDGFIDASATNPVFSGQHALQIRLDDPRLTALRILTSENLDPNGYQSVSFYIYGTEAGQTVNFEAWDSVSITLESQTINLPTNEWIRVEMPLNQLETEWELQAFVFRNASSATPFYIDQIELTPKAPIGANKIYLPFIQ